MAALRLIPRMSKHLPTKSMQQIMDSSGANVILAGILSFTALVAIAWSRTQTQEGPSQEPLNTPKSCELTHNKDAVPQTASITLADGSRFTETLEQKSNLGRSGRLVGQSDRVQVLDKYVTGTTTARYCSVYNSLVLATNENGSPMNGTYENGWVVYPGESVIPKPTPQISRLEQN